jgi:hypothetical protein
MVEMILRSKDIRFSSENNLIKRPPNRLHQPTARGRSG